MLVVLTPSSATASSSQTFVVVCGVSNCVGRLLAGILSDRCSGWLGRPTLFALFLLIMASSQLLLVLVDGVPILYVACTLCFIACEHPLCSKHV